MLELDREEVGRRARSIDDLTKEYSTGKRRDRLYDAPRRGQFGWRLLVGLGTDHLDARDRGLDVEGPGERVLAR